MFGAQVGSLAEQRQSVGAEAVDYLAFGNDGGGSPREHLRHTVCGDTEMGAEATIAAFGDGGGAVRLASGRRCRPGRGEHDRGTDGGGR